MKRFNKKNYSEHNPNDVDNVIPVNRIAKTDEVIADYGRVFLNLKKIDDFDLCRLLVIIEYLKREVGYQNYLDADNSDQMVISNKSKLKIKKYHFITEEKIAKALGMSPRGFRKRKAEIANRIIGFINNPRGTKIPPHENN